MPPYPSAPPTTPYQAPQQTYSQAPQSYSQAPQSYPQAPQSYPQAPPYQAVQPYQPAPGYPAYGAPAFPAARPNSGAAIASLVCGIAGLVLGFGFFWAFFPLLISIAAVITGHIALKKLKQNPGLGGRGMAIAGLITGYVGTGFLVITVIIAIGTFLLLGGFALPFLFAG